MLDGYVEERKERLARIRAVGRLFVKVFVPLGPEPREFRMRAGELMEGDPRMYLPIAAMFAGPGTIPSVRFVDQLTEVLARLAQAEPVEDAVWRR